MCFDLTLKDRVKKNEGKLRMKKAISDIIVYKCIYINGEGRYYSLRDRNGKKMSWKRGYWYTELDKIYINHRNEIHGGGFHSYKYISDANGLLGYINYVKIVKMIIPKGTYYYENEREYVSKSLIYPRQKINK